MLNNLTNGLSNAFNFSSRASRGEFICIISTYVLFAFFLAPLLDSFFYASSKVPPFKALTLMLLTLPVISVSVRRLHDHNLSGKWTLSFLVGGIGFVLLLPVLLSEGQEEPNRFGEPII
ncbi:MAG TPA: DUF805 domain-containing protein [Gammaproteobacteria bacterium]|nr:DUF805 domain-containing protein [Gammaproteobacteria bacterium]